MVSEGSPVMGVQMRLRHSQGNNSSGDDLEDDACSTNSKVAPQLQSLPRTRSWIEIVENFLWIAAVIFIIYYGDRHSNLIHLVLLDDRIRRTPLYLGMLAFGLNICFVYTSLLVLGVRKSNEKLEISSLAALPFIIILGLISCCLFSFALWPIWSFLTLPLVFTLFMAFMVVLPYMMLGTLKPQIDALRTD